MSERVVKYLKALARRNVPLSMRCIESLSSDFDVTQKDLEKLSRSALGYLESGSLIRASEEELYRELRNFVFSAYHDKELLLFFLPALTERYRKDKLKFVFDLLCLACAQAKCLGASNEEIGDCAHLVIEKNKKLKRSYQILALIFFISVCVLFYYLYKPRDWFKWLLNPFSPSVRSLRYLGKVGEVPYEEPLGSSKSLPLQVSLDADLPSLPLKVERSFINLFEEAHLYDIRAEITLVNDWDSFAYNLSVKDINDKEVESFGGQVELSCQALGREGVTLPIELQFFQLGKPKGVPHKLSLQLSKVKNSPAFQQDEGREPLEIVNLTKGEPFLEGFLLHPVWKENLGIWRGQFVLELKIMRNVKLRELKVLFSLLNDQGEKLDSFETVLLNKEHSLPLSSPQRRRFFIEHDFLKVHLDDPLKSVKSYQLEVLSWQ